MISRLRRAATTPARRSLDGEGRVRSNVISSQEVHDRFGGVVPEIASRHHLELVNLVVAQRARACRDDLDEVDLVAATQGPGPGGGTVGGLRHRQGVGRRAGAAVRCGGPPPGPRGRKLRSRRAGPHPPVRAPLRVPDCQRRTHAAGARARARGLRGAGEHARRRRGGGVRQGRPDAWTRLPRRARARTPRGERRPEAFPFPAGGPQAGARHRPPGVRAQPGLLLRRPEDLAAL